MGMISDAGGQLWPVGEDSLVRDFYVCLFSIEISQIIGQASKEAARVADVCTVFDETGAGRDP